MALRFLLLLMGWLWCGGMAVADTLRLLTWPGYAPPEVRERFTLETGHHVKVTLSDNADMLLKLRATGGAGFDLVQPSLERVLPLQRQYDLFRPIDPARIDPALFEPGILAAARRYATLDGKLLALPHLWGSSGLVVDRRQAGEVRDYLDLCRPGLAGRVALPLNRQSLTAFAFAMGRDPFALYDRPKAYAGLMQRVEARLQSCQQSAGDLFWRDADALRSAFRTGGLVAALAWDEAAWRLRGDLPEIRFVAPQSGALGWIDGFVLPRQGRADDVAFAWIRFVLRAEIAAGIARLALAVIGLLGFVTVWHQPDPYLDNLHVDPARRSAGLGRRLMRAAAARLVQQAEGRVYLWVVEANIRAIDFYRRLGGQVVENRINDIAGTAVPCLKVEWTDLVRLAGSLEDD